MRWIKAVANFPKTCTNNPIVLIFVPIVFLFAFCKQEGTKKKCNHSHQFCFYVKDTSLVTKKTFHSLEKTFKQNKFKFLKNSEYWVSFISVTSYTLRIINVGGELDYDFLSLPPSMGDPRKSGTEIVDNYLDGLMKCFFKKGYLGFNEQLIMTGIHFPDKIGKRTSPIKLPSSNGVAHKNSLYHIVDNFDMGLKK